MISMKVADHLFSTAWRKSGVVCYCYIDDNFKVPLHNLSTMESHPFYIGHRLTGLLCATETFSTNIDISNNTFRLVAMNE